MIWYVKRTAATVMLAGLLLHLGAQPTAANERTTFRGCVSERTDQTIVLRTSADESVTIDTGWIKPDTLHTALADCVTVMTLTVDGRFVAESIEAGDEPNEVNSVTNETTADREQRARQRNERDDKGGNKKND
jgi:hypothetical protein